jgi:hypothetical protein
MKYFLIILLCANAISSSAQPNSPAWDSLVNNAAVFNVFSVSAAPKNLPNLKPFTSAYTWESILQVGLGVFYDAPRNWQDSTVYHDNRDIVADGLVGTHYQGRNLRWEIGVTYPKPYSNYKKFYAEIMQPIFKNAALREIFYAWAAPHYKRIFKRLPMEAQMMYLGIIDASIAFLENYDYKKELKYYDKLARKNELADFATQANPKNKDKIYQNCPRSLSAFCFRRIHNGEFTQAELLDFGTRFASLLKEK